MGIDPHESLRQRVAARKSKEEIRAKALEELQAKEAKLCKALRETTMDRPIKAEFHELVKICPKMGQHLSHGPALYVGGVVERSPYVEAVSELLKLEPIRELKEWKPQGKSAEALFRSLGSHLLAKYPLPPFLWNGFMGPQRVWFIPMVRHLALGGSLAQYIKTSNFPVKLTRKLCHDFLKTPANTGVIPALRGAQIRGLGGSNRLLTAVLSTPLGSTLCVDQAMEDFYQAMFLWFVNQPMLDPQQVAPMVDYIRHCRDTDTGYTLKGRTALSLMRGMEEWHTETARRSEIGHKGASHFKPSGFSGAEYDFSRDSPTGKIIEIWRIAEILTAKALADEGKRQGHCVFSYSRRIETGSCSIWTLSKEDNKSLAEHGGVWNMLTLEVRNDIRQVVQARGRFNRCATTHEKNILSRWMAMGAYV
jgi:hypothetical protein